MTSRMRQTKYLNEMIKKSLFQLDNGSEFISSVNVCMESHQNVPGNARDCPRKKEREREIDFAKRENTDCLCWSILKSPPVLDLLHILIFKNIV